MWPQSKPTVDDEKQIWLTKLISKNNKDEITEETTPEELAQIISKRIMAIIDRQLANAKN